MNVRSFLARSLALAIGLQLVLGCAGQRAFQSGEQLLREEQYDAAVGQFSEAVTKKPDSHKYRAQLAVSRQRGGWAHLEAGRDALAQNRLEQAVGEFRIALELDPTLGVARQELKQAEGRLRARQLLAEAEEFSRQRRFPQAQRNIEEALLLNPGDPRALELRDQVREGRRTVVDGFELDVVSDKPITLRFKNARIKEVFGLLSKLSGINFIFDEDLKDQNISVLLEQATFAQALELLLKMNGLGKRVLNAKTIIIYTSNKEKDKQYQDQVIQTFYLSNIEAKKAVNLLRTLLQLRKIYVHEELNALVIRDTPDVVKLAQQILEAADRADAEVVFELELVEVNQTDDLLFGPTLSTYSTKFGFVPPGTTSVPDSVTIFDGLRNLDFLYTIPTATFNLKKTLKDSEILAEINCLAIGLCRVVRLIHQPVDDAKFHPGSRAFCCGSLDLL
jgi:general secretion pathway protein D